MTDVDFIITPGAKERISANTGRAVFGSWTPFSNKDGEEVGYYSVSVEQAFALACAIERLVLTVRHSPSDPKAPL